MEVNAGIFDSIAKNYAAYRPAYPEKLFEYLGGLAPRDSRVWDCACGNGQVASGLSQYFRSVEASDTSPGQIEHAPLLENISYSVRSAENSGFPDGHFNLICIGMAYHWFDHERFCAEADRLLVSRGALAVFGYAEGKVDRDIDNYISENLFPLLKPYFSKGNSVANRRYQDITFPFMAEDVPDIEMNLHWNADRFVGYLLTWSPLQRFFNEDRDNAVAFWESFEKGLFVLWPSQEVRQVRFVFTLIVRRK